MRIICLLTALLFVGANLNAQDDDINYLFKKKKDHKVGGFVSPGVQVGMLDGEVAASTSFSGALIIDHKLFFGGYGQSMATNHEFGKIYETTDLAGTTTTKVYEKQSIQFSHGGFLLGYVFMPKNAIHFGISAGIGVGSVSVSPTI